MQRVKIITDCVFRGVEYRAEAQAELPAEWADKLIRLGLAQAILPEIPATRAARKRRKE